MEHIVAPHAKYLVSYDGVDEAFVATAVCSGITAYSALKKLNYLNANQTCLIVGAGGVGLAAMEMAKAVLKSKITVADIDPEKSKVAIATGADKAFYNSATDAAKQLMVLTNGCPIVLWISLGLQLLIHLHFRF